MSIISSHQTGGPLGRSVIITSSVTRFGELLPTWDILKVFGNFLRAYLVFDKIWKPTLGKNVLFGKVSLL